MADTRGLPRSPTTNRKVLEQVRRPARRPHRMRQAIAGLQPDRAGVLKPSAPPLCSRR